MIVHETLDSFWLRVIQVVTKHFPHGRWSTGTLVAVPTVLVVGLGVRMRRASRNTQYSQSGASSSFAIPNFGHGALSP